MAFPQNAFFGVLFISGQGQGWQEKYWFRSDVADYGTGLGIIQWIAYYRTCFLGTGYAISFARVSNSDSTRDGLSCRLPYPLGPHSTWGAAGSGGPDEISEPESPFEAVMTRHESTGGKWGNRLWRGAPDLWIAGRKLVYPQYWQPLSAGTPSDPTPAGTANHLTLCQSFWSYLINNVPLMHRNSDKTLTQNNVAYINAIRITKRSSGRPFGQSRGRNQANVVRGG